MNQSILVIQSLFTTITCRHFPVIQMFRRSIWAALCDSGEEELPLNRKRPLRSASHSTFRKAGTTSEPAGWIILFYEVFTIWHDLIIQFEREIIGQCPSFPPQLSGIKWRWHKWSFSWQTNDLVLNPWWTQSHQGSPFRGDNQVYKMLLTFQSERTVLSVLVFFL